MPRITFYVVQTFVESKEGFVAERPFECETAGDARLRAQLRAPPIKAGVVAWARSGDPDAGKWDDDPKILFQAGRVE